MPKLVVSTKNNGNKGKRSKKQKGIVTDIGKFIDSLRDETSVPVAQNTKSTVSRPRFVQSSGGICINHREYIGPVQTIAAATFENRSWAINPGNRFLFPWLALIARNYESYRVHSLAFEYRCSCPSTTIGKIGICVDYDASDVAPIDLQEFMINKGAVLVAPWNSTMHVCSLDDLSKMKERYVHAGIAPVGSDVKTYDAGKLHICTDGGAATTAYGDLFAKYSIELLTPQIPEVGEATTISTQALSATNLVGESAVTSYGNPPVSWELRYVDRYTFIGKFVGVVIAQIVGTVITGPITPSFQNASGQPYVFVNLSTPNVVASATHVIQMWDVSANEGDYIVPTLAAATTVTAATWRFLPAKLAYMPLL